MILLQLFLTFFKIGLFTFGGGYAMLPLIQEEVLKNGWTTENELVNFIAVSESTPGPFAVNISTFIGSRMSGVAGSLLSTLGVVLPSFVIILVVARFFMKFKENRFVKGCMSGLKPAVIGLIATAILNVGKDVFFRDGFSTEMFTGFEFYILLSVFALMFFLALKTKVHPIFLILISAAVGVASGYILQLSV